MPKFLVHSAGLFEWFSPYPTTLDQRLSAILDAGYDGVEISNGVSILEWKPNSVLAERLQHCIVTIHAELGDHFQHTSLKDLERCLRQMPFTISNVTVHPDELMPFEFNSLDDFAFPLTLENMDSTRANWKSPDEFRRYLTGNIALTYDTAHAEENNLSASDFSSLPIRETHLSFPDLFGYFSGRATRHALTLFRPDQFPPVPKCQFVTVEGVVPVSGRLLAQELSLIRSRLAGQVL